MEADTSCLFIFCRVLECIRLNDLFLMRLVGCRAPRLASVPYDEDGGAGAAKGERRLEKRRNKLRRGEVMETLREEFGDQPETVRCVILWVFGGIVDFYNIETYTIRGTDFFRIGVFLWL